MPQADYYERQEARRERYELRAERARQESDAAARQAEKMASIIPMGQPILVGHHSEGRDRRYRARIGQTMDKAISLDKKAAYYEEKAECVGQSGISSDAPDALERLEKKLAECGGEFVPLDAVIAAFEAAESVTALKEAATRLGIPENHPASEAIYAAYRERQRKIEAQDKECAA